MKIKLSEFWFDPNAVRRRAGIVYEVPESMRNQLPSDTEILDDKLNVVETIGKKKVEPKQVVEVQIVTDKDAVVTTDLDKTVAVDDRDANKAVDVTRPVSKPSENAVTKSSKL